MFRPYKKDDHSLLIEMMNEFYHSPAVLHPVPMDNFLRTCQELDSDSPYAEAYIFEQNDLPAGYALLAKTYSNEAGGMVVWVEEVYIRPDFRGCGLGSGFLQYIKDTYSKSAARLRLEVEDDNIGAMRLYDRQGYKKLAYTQMIQELL